MRAAIKNSGYEFPMRRIVVNLAPATIRKSSAGLDLAIALGVLIASGQIKGRDVYKRQRYFPLVGQDGKLLPMFLTVRNGSDHSIEVVQAGNERVLRARLDDAKFFFNEDRKKPLIDRQDGLTKIVFQEGLGNLSLIHISFVI